MANRPEHWAVSGSPAALLFPKSGRRFGASVPCSSNSFPASDSEGCLAKARDALKRIQAADRVDVLTKFRAELERLSRKHESGATSMR